VPLAALALIVGIVQLHKLDFVEPNAKLAALFTHGRHVVVPDSSHYIQYDQPQAVIDAVKRAIKEIRAR
jgi:pimeloyl-ACP methyl ester carboxylesterase